MTLVGPRPHMVSENQIYESLIPNYSLRYRVKPGITGLGQVNNGILTTPLRKMEIRIYWDTFYIINWKPGMDTLILYRTLIYFLNTLNIFQPSEALLGKVAAK